MTAEIVRVHGEAALTEVVWPAKELSALLAVPPQLPCTHLRLVGSCECTTWERKCETIFAGANGWSAHPGRWERRWGGLDVERELLPLLDHFSLLHARGTRRIIGFLSHDYQANRDFSALGDRIVVDRLPASWYWPAGGKTTAFLLRLADGSRRMGRSRSPFGLAERGEDRLRGNETLTRHDMLVFGGAPFAGILPVGTQ